MLTHRLKALFLSLFLLGSFAATAQSFSSGQSGPALLATDDPSFGGHGCG